MFTVKKVSASDTIDQLAVLESSIDVPPVTEGVGALIDPGATSFLPAANTPRAAVAKPMFFHQSQPFTLRSTASVRVVEAVTIGAVVAYFLYGLVSALAGA